MSEAQLPEVSVHAAAAMFAPLVAATVEASKSHPASSTMAAELGPRRVVNKRKKDRGAQRQRNMVVTPTQCDLELSRLITMICRLAVLLLGLRAYARRRLP